jgi:hypothetical protein
MTPNLTLTALAWSPTQTITPNLTLTALAWSPTQTITPNLTLTFLAWSPTFTPTPNLTLTFLASSPTPTPTMVITGSPAPSVTPGTSYPYPQPVVGPIVRFAYYMVEPGTVKIKVWTAGADLAAVLEEHKDAGAQSSTLDVSSFATGHYFYAIILSYDSGWAQKLVPGKFGVIH